MQKKSIRGFSLIEVIVAMAIFLTIVFPFLSAYILSTKINQQAFYVKRATDALEIAQEDIKTWDEDILEVLSNLGLEWSYLNTQDGTSMYAAFRKLLDDDDVDYLDIDGVRWGEGLDICFAVLKDTSLEGTDTLDTNEPDALRSGYDVFIRVSEDSVKIVPKNVAATTLENEDTNNNGVGYYMDVVLGDTESSYKILKVPSNTYIPLEKLEGNKKVLFGGLEWYTLFNSTAGDVALMYIPKDESQQIIFPFDATNPSNPRFKKSIVNSWQNIAYYLNNEFYNSLVYSEYVYSENYYTNRNWIKKHNWQIGELGKEVDETTVENIGLLRKDEIEKMVLTAGYNDDAYTLTPEGSTVHLIKNDRVAPDLSKYIYPVIYLDKDLYCKISDEEGYRLYDATTDVFKKNIVDSAVLNNTLNLVSKQTVSGSKIKMMVYFDKNLPETNFDNAHYEKLRFLVNVTDNRSSKTADGLTVYTINNKDMGNYKWLNIKNANKTTDFKIVDSIYLEEDYTGWPLDSTELLRKFKVNGYIVYVWAEYMAPDEYRGDNPYMNQHESLIVYLNKEVDVPIFYYKKASESFYEEGRNH